MYLYEERQTVRQDPRSGEQSSSRHKGAENKEVYAPVWECLDCGKKVAFFDWQDPICPADPRHTMRKADPEGLIRKAWKPPKGFPKGFYLILKLGDYCSGWLSGETCETFRPYPTQEQWDKFQAETKIAWPRCGARWALA